MRRSVLLLPVFCLAACGTTPEVFDVIGDAADTGGGADATVDSGDDTDSARPDAEADVPGCPGSTCVAVGLRCEGQVSVACEVGPDNCLVEVRTNCLESFGALCDDVTGGCIDDPLPCDDECDLEGATCEGTGEVVVCSRAADGCLDQAVVECGADSLCTDGVCAPYLCSGDGIPAAPYCDGETYVTCREDDGGGFVDVRRDCGDSGQACDAAAGGCVGACESGCEFDVMCEGTTLVTCTDGPDGCAVVERVDCAADGGTCGRGTCVEPDPCASVETCAAPLVICDGDVWSRCAADARGCLVETRVDCAADGQSCGATSTGPACVSALCSGLPACDPADFDPRCDGVSAIECRVTRAGCFAEVPVNCSALGRVCVEDAGGAACEIVPCGDGVIGSGEECDDGNLFSGDGCDFECAQEDGFFCAGEPSTCVAVECGDGLIGVGEGCDDDSASCSDSCQLRIANRGESVAITASIAATAPSFVAPNPGCTAGFGAGQYVARWYVNETGAPQEVTFVVTSTSVGAGFFDVTIFDETWLPGSEPLGCRLAAFGNATATLGPVALAAGEVVVVVVSMPTAAAARDFAITATSAGCGDGVVSATLGESCDDRGHTGGDGCSATCGIEPGWSCTGAPSVCRIPECGDGIVDAPVEECDDANGFNGDGCDFECLIEDDFGCVGAPSSCFPVVCGDAIIALSEGCEDGNTVSGDGCSDTCQIELEAGTVRTATGSLDAADPLFARPSQTCGAGSAAPSHHYDAYWVRNPGSAPLTVDVAVAFDGDGFLFWMDGDFDPDSPTANCLAANDDAGGIRSSALTGLVVPPGEARVVVVSTFATNGVIGPYTISITAR